MTKLICFDMDGVIFRPLNFWLELHKVYGTYKEGLALTKKYYQGSYQKLVDEVIGRLWKGKPTQPYFEIIKKTKYVPGAQETLQELKTQGYKTAIITTGPDDLAERAKKECGLNYVFANKLFIKNNQVVGSKDLKYWPLRFGNKAQALKQLCQKHHIDLKDVIIVGNGFSDIKMARIAGFAIAFNPLSEELVKYCNAVVKGKNLKLILKPIQKFEEERWTS